jgi:hypothetical protein
MNFAVPIWKARYGTCWADDCDDDRLRVSGPQRLPWR